MAAGTLWKRLHLHRAVATYNIAVPV
jgi:hypothetical protein